MTSQHTLTYMATDIIGYSLLTEKNQLTVFELLESYRAIVIPLIENEGGTSIVCTADAVTACFSSCHSAIRSGFSIQKALLDWSKASASSALTTRIGIHTNRPADQGHTQQLSITLAQSLESLGDAQALSISHQVLDSTRDEKELHYYSLGGQDLDYLPEPLEMFYLYEKKPCLFTRLCLQLKYVKAEYLHRNINTYSITAMSVMLLAAVLLLNSAVNTVPGVEFSKVLNLSGGADEGKIQALSRLIKSRLVHISASSAQNEAVSELSAIHLQCSFQRIGNRVRLTWSILDQAIETQTSGGEVSGPIADLDALQMHLLENISSQVVLSNS
jgi:hypothetical protein